VLLLNNPPALKYGPTGHISTSSIASLHCVRPSHGVGSDKYCSPRHGVPFLSKKRGC
jgi:hypothetical protein